jgi:flavin reductase (DIM6/NTAB) family NADH-FMN oxidoreductase RutF
MSFETDVISPQINAPSLRSVLGTFATGVVVATTFDENDKPVGITANSFSSVSLDPPLVCWCLKSNSYSLPAFRQSRRFAINVLGAEHVHLCKRFALASAYKWQDLRYHIGERGCPLLAHSIATLECKLFAEHEAGDHFILIGQVEKAEATQSAAPLVVYRGDFYDLGGKSLSSG